MFEFKSVKNMFVALGAGALVVIGLAVIIYVSIARDRITAEPTATLAPSAEMTATAGGATETPTPNGATPTPTAAVSLRGTVKEYEPGALIIVIAPAQGTVDQVIVPENLEVTWSGGGRASPQDIAVGQDILAEGQLDSLGRLVARRIVLSGAGATPTALASATATPTAASTATPVLTIPLGAWLGEYYGNTALSGDATLVRQDQAINYDWGTGAPAAGLPTDGFAVRWRGRWQLAEGAYRVYAYTDDGVRVWVDGAVIIDQWRDQNATQVSAEVYLAAGEHTVQVEYYDRGGSALARVWWDSLGQYPDWKGEYFGNPRLEGSAAVVRNDAELDFDWGAGSPAAGLPVDGFGVRWSRKASFDEGNYRFLASVDDGVRLWVDGILVIDEWHASTLDTYEGYIWLTAGAHDLRVDYYESAGDANIRLWWERAESFGDWRAEYYSNPDLSGRPMLLRNDTAMAYDWGEGSPAVNLPADGFSARWTRTVRLDKGRYRFWTIADDGVRIYVDGSRIIDEWRDSLSELYAGEISLESGDHTIKIEYYERDGSASIEWGWGVLQTPTPTLTSTPGATATPPPTASPTATTVPTATQTPSAEPSATPTATSTETEVAPDFLIGE